MRFPIQSLWDLPTYLFLVNLLNAGVGGHGPYQWGVPAPCPAREEESLATQGVVPLTTEGLSMPLPRKHPVPNS